MKKEKPNCYKCKYRGGVAGSVHSSCNHPTFSTVKDNPLLNLMSIFASVGRVAPVQVKSEKVIVRGNPHGVKSGWFNHPFAFDTIWLEECNGFEIKE